MGINMKDEEEVKQYLDNLNLEYQFSCYKENNGEGCCLLGEFMTNIRTNYEKAAAAFRKGCDKHDHAKACFKYGAALFRGRGIKQDVSAALQYQKKGCDLGWKDSCFTAGCQYMQDKTPQNLRSALDYFVRACDMGQADGCASASAMYYDGEDILETDIAKTIEYGSRACELGEAQSCANISFLYKSGELVEKDEKKAVYYRSKALDIAHQYRRNRGFEMEQGITDS